MDCLMHEFFGRDRQNTVLLLAENAFPGQGVLCLLQAQGHLELFHTKPVTGNISRIINQALNPFQPVLKFCIVPEQRGECNYCSSDYPVSCLLIHLAVVSLNFCLSHITCLLIMFLLFFLLQSVNKGFFSVYNPSPPVMHFQLYSDNFLEWKHKVHESVRLREWLVLVLFHCRMTFGLFLF